MAHKFTKMENDQTQNKKELKPEPDAPPYPVQKYISIFEAFCKLYPTMDPSVLQIGPGMRRRTPGVLQQAVQRAVQRAVQQYELSVEEYHKEVKQYHTLWPIATELHFRKAIERRLEAAERWYTTKARGRAPPSAVPTAVPEPTTPLKPRNQSNKQRAKKQKAKKNQGAGRQRATTRKRGS